MDGIGNEGPGPLPCSHSSCTLIQCLFVVVFSCVCVFFY